MPIRRDLRWQYPIDWPQISHRIRFVRAKGRCEICGRPHRARVPQLPDGRWLDEASWRDDRGRKAKAPPPDEAGTARKRFIILQAAHRDHDPTNNRERNLVAVCGRCHLRMDRDEHRRRRRLNWLRRRAIGDLFLGSYPAF